MKRLTLLLALAIAACAAPGSRDRYQRLLTPTANPSEVVATELAFARAAQEDGQWTAFREYSTGDAVMFVPEAVNAHDWLSKQQNPAQSVAWQPHQVWSSCDGSMAVTKGAWQRPDGSFGYFTTVWERQGNGEYKWTMDQGDALAQPLLAPDFIQTQVADCTEVLEETAGMVSDPATGLQAFSGNSRDETLEWNAWVNPDLSRTLRVSIWKDGEKQDVLESRVAAPAP